MALLRPSDSSLQGNVVLATELQRLYILDSFGHSIVSRRIIPFTACIILANGSLTDKYVILCIGREGELCLYMHNDQDTPTERTSTTARILSAALSFPDLVLVGADQTVTHSMLSNSNFKMMAKKYTLKLAQQPLKAEFIKTKNQKLLLVALETEVRLYNEKEVIYTYVTDYRLYSVIWGSFAREDNCLILLYEHAGF